MPRKAKILPTAQQVQLADPQKPLRDKLRKKYQTTAKAAAGKSKVAAIRLQCIECCGGEVKEARLCESKDCFLWPHAFGRRKNLQ